MPSASELRNGDVDRNRGGRWTHLAHLMAVQHKQIYNKILRGRVCYNFIPNLISRANLPVAT